MFGHDDSCDDDEIAGLALTSGQEEIGFAESQPASRPAAVVSFMPVAGARPRIVAAAEEQEAHLRRLATLRKKAGRTLWDEVVEPLVVEAAVG